MSSSSSSSTASSIRSRGHDLIHTIPPTTIGIIGLCCIIYAFQWIGDPYLHHYTMCPRSILYLHEYHRLWTSCVFHGSLGHLATNMVSTYVLSQALEHQKGTFPHLVSTLWAMMLSSVVYMGIAWIANTVANYSHLMYQHSLGFSGVLFHMCVLEANSISSGGSRSVFGMLTVPSYVYPFVLLLLIQVFMPHISFVGHLSGILTGTLELYGVLDDTLFPSSTYFQTVESSSSNRVVQWIMKHPKYVKTPATTTNETLGGQVLQQRRTPRMLIRAIWNGILLLWKFIKDVMETLKVCIFGRGRHANSNVQLSGGSLWTSTTTTPTITTPTATHSGTLVNKEEESDDEDWVGLPSMSSLGGSPQDRDTESQLL
mmetsp:Transcript_13494/g.21042  ORF Transcript_13494/g.21042 Transcript_13494/m.21042 type:complete len:371 (+) Transcript_13494:215-1327(+)